MTTFKCQIHSVSFGVADMPSGFPVECPVCMREELNRANAALRTVRDERNALLRAIEIKREALVELLRA